MNWRWRLIRIRLALALVASGASALALSHSFLGPVLGEGLGTVSLVLSWIPGLGAVSFLSGTRATFFYTFIALIWLTTLYLSPLSLRPVGGSERGEKRLKAVAALYLVVLAPAVVSHSSVNWLRFLLHRPLNYSAPPLIETVVLSLVTLFCLFSIYLVTRWQEVSNRLTAQGAEAMDREDYLRGSLHLGFTVAGGALALTAAVLLLAFGITRGLDQAFRYIPWPVVVLGLVGVSVVAMVVFRAMFQSPSTTEDLQKEV